MAYPFDLRRIKTRQALLIALGIDEVALEGVINFEPPPRRLAPEPDPPTAIATIHLPLFLRHDIPKRNKRRGYRTAWEPTLLKNEYRALGRRLDSFFRLCLDGYPHKRAFGYHPGRNIRENALPHAGHQRLLSLDVTSFFPSITDTRIERLFTSLDVEPEVAKLLSQFVTVGSVLPLGVPTSPTISNAIALPIDVELEAIATRLGATYTRYADDISFSSNHQLPEVEEIRSCLAFHGFELAEAKTRWSKIGQAHFVTGLSVSDPAQPHVPRGKKRALRQELHYARKFGLDGHFRHGGINDAKIIQMQVNRLDGLVKFVAHHEQRMASKLKVEWAGILRDSNMKPSFAPKNQHREPFYMFIDEAEFQRGGQKILALGMAVSQHASQIVTETREVLAGALGDLWAAGDVRAIEKRGLHFADATEDLRLEYVRRLASMPFEGFVAFAPYERSADYEETYLRLLSLLIPRRFKAAESKYAHLYFEGNCKVSQDAIKTCVQQAHDDLKQRDDRRPLLYNLEFVNKPNMAVSVPDFLLGVLGKYLQSKSGQPGMPEPRDRLLFERLRDKYRLILDVEHRVEYSRRRPITPWQ